MAKDLKDSVAVVAEAWEESPYYDDAEKWTFIFWSAAHPFRPLFDKLDLTTTLELACGHGRHAERTAPLANRMVLMDVHQGNLDFCRERMKARRNIEYHLCNGYDFQPLPDRDLTAIYCYDAMVHFSPDLVASYLKDAKRVLKPGGRALFHHSNTPAPNDRHYGLNPAARNHMTLELFGSLAAEAGLEIMTSQRVTWGGVEGMDGVTLVQA